MALTRREMIVTTGTLAAAAAAATGSPALAADGRGMPSITSPRPSTSRC